jgi:hypothetical protein
MKITKFISFLFVIATLASCSSSDSDGGSSAASSVVLDGTNLTITSASAQRSEDTFAITADVSDGTSVQILFNKQGNLEEFSYWEDVDTYFNYQYYKSNYFTFNLISVNESTHKVKVSFSGTIYQDETDLNSTSKEVSGSFDLPYTVQTPMITGLGLHCKIAGNDWYETDMWDNGWTDVDRKCISDDDNMMIIRFTDSSIAVGTYNFTTASGNKIQLGKFDTTAHDYTEFNTSGTMTITANTEYFGFRVIEGTYSFTATNPSNASNQVQVTNGAFKLNF